jgi:hypothetical protein
MSHSGRAYRWHDAEMGPAGRIVGKAGASRSSGEVGLVAMGSGCAVGCGRLRGARPDALR